MGSVVIALSSPFGLAWWLYVGVGVALYLPTLLQPFCQAKPFKMFSRSMLGVAVVALWFGAALLPGTAIGWSMWSVFVVTFVSVAFGSLAFRHRFTPAPDARCPFGGYPLCTFRECQPDQFGMPGGSPLLDYVAELRAAGVEVEVCSGDQYTGVAAPFSLAKRRPIGPNL